MRQSFVRYGWFSVLGITLLVFSGCGSNEKKEPQEMSKADAKKIKGDWPIDFCEWFGWYGDGICDDFCPQPDSDCLYNPQSCESQECQGENLYCSESKQCLFIGSCEEHDDCVYFLDLGNDWVEAWEQQNLPDEHGHNLCLYEMDGSVIAYCDQNKVCQCSFP